jgi:hypothetical protein
VRIKKGTFADVPEKPFSLEVGEPQLWRTMTVRQDNEKATKIASKEYAGHEKSPHHSTFSLMILWGGLSTFPLYPSAFS